MNKIHPTLRWVLLLPAGLLTYLVVHFAAIIFGKIQMFIVRDPMSEQFYEFILAPALAGYFSLDFPLKMFEGNSNLPRLVLCTSLCIAYGVLMGGAIFTWSCVSILSCGVSALLTGFAYWNNEPFPEGSLTN